MRIVCIVPTKIFKDDKLFLEVFSQLYDKLLIAKLTVFKEHGLDYLATTFTLLDMLPNTVSRLPLKYLLRPSELRTAW